MAECRRSATMSADVCGDDGVARPLARSGSGSGVVAYLRHADSRGVSSPGTLRCAPRTGLWQSAVAPRRCVRMSAVMGWRDRSRGRDGGDAAEQGWRVSRMRSAARTRFQLTPDSASGDSVEMERCTAGRCRCRCSAGVCQRRRSAAHVRRCVCPRRCRGLTEDVTARAVGLCHCCAKRRRLGSGRWLIWWREAG